MEMRKVAVGAALAVGVVLAIRFIFPDEGRDDVDPSLAGHVDTKDDARTSTPHGIRARQSDVAGPRTEFFGGVSDHERVRNLAGAALDLESLDVREWAQTRIALEDARRFDTEDECRRRLAWPPDLDPTCEFIMTSVMDHEGRVVYVRIEETDARVLSRDCGALASCVAEDRLRTTFVLPEAHEGELAVKQYKRTKPLGPDFDDASYVGDVVALLEDDLRGAEELKSTPDLEFAKLQQLNYVNYLKSRLIRLGDAD